MNRGFREDENELPYLLWQKRDKIKAGNPKPFNINIQNRPFEDFESTVRGLIIPDDDRANIISSVEVRPKNCRFSVKEPAEKRGAFASQRQTGALYPYVPAIRFLLPISQDHI